MCVCVSSGLAVWHWATIGVHVPGEDYCFHLQHSLAVCRSLRGLTHGFPVYIGMTIAAVLVYCTLGQSCQRHFMGIVGEVTRRYNLTGNI